MTDPATQSSRFIPDAIYNIFVYFSTGIVFFSCFAVLFLDLTSLLISWYSFDSGLKITSMIFVASLIYGYSQIASVVSYHLVKKPVSIFAKAVGSKAKKDFFFIYPQLLKNFSVLDLYPAKRTSNYWTIIYWAKANHPDIANDLLERYARVKIARLNAFNSLVLLVLTLAAYSSNFGHLFEDALVSYANVRMIVLWISLMGTLGFGFELYQRQCWFGDIVVKIFASMVGAVDKTGGGVFDTYGKHGEFYTSDSE